MDMIVFQKKKKKNMDMITFEKPWSVRITSQRCLPLYLAKINHNDRPLGLDFGVFSTFIIFFKF